MSDDIKSIVYVKRLKYKFYSQNAFKLFIDYPFNFMTDKLGICSVSKFSKTGRGTRCFKCTYFIEK